MSTTCFRVIVADDDEPICNLIKSYLSSFEEVEVVGIALNGEDLLTLARREKPDALFVDIQMPGLDGLSVVYALQKEFPNLFVVFISAYPWYAVEAFNLDATDFIMKPVTSDRLAKALAKLKRFSHFVATHGGTTNSTTRDDSKGRLLLKLGHGALLINKSNIFFIEKQGKKSIIHTTWGRYETPHSLADLEKSLSEPEFFRCHKSFIINTRMVERITPYADRSYEVSFYSYSEKVTMRREKFEEFCSLLNKLSE